jgi:cytochrome b involved in lipid metabolism
MNLLKCVTHHEQQIAEIKTERYINNVGHAVALWLKHYTTTRQFAGSIPDVVLGIFL